MRKQNMNIWGSRHISEKLKRKPCFEIEKPNKLIKNKKISNTGFPRVSKDSMFRLVNAMWPAKILLDPRIKDESTWKFNLLERVS